MKQPELVTFASTSQEIQTAINSGIDHLILEDPCLSARCTEQKIDPSFQSLNKLIQEAKDSKPTLKLSFNSDIMIHDQHFPLLHTLIDVLKKHHIQTIRIQDPGLILFIQAHYPSASIHLATETANNSISSLQTFTELGVKRQVLTNEMPYTVISQLDTLECELELQVQGPILIQYAYRRFMYNALIQQGETPPNAIVKLAEDKDFPKRYFGMIDNHHGHFMFAHFDRCLLTELPNLLKLPLSSWLIDTRGSDNPTAQTLLQTYKRALTTCLKSPENWDPAKELNHLKKQIKKPLKPGFFISNKTDSDWRDQHHSKKQSGNLIGKVIHSQKGQSLIIDCITTLDPKTKLVFSTPEHKTIPLAKKEIFTIDENPIQIGKKQTLVRLPWQKGISVGSLLLQDCHQ
ncbi:hypothetical protein DID77_01385 [Candidatus Marinamargulisbacteria bacterium SCGC AG-439-L15]|nr:hypothetical protein DID77_01385 [Candidatus Marinamargulisbacteria bacterium SCGC AG-439-L15]